MSTGSAAKKSERTPLSALFKNCWSAEALSSKGWRGFLQSSWRIVVTTFHGVKENRLPQQSAALTYYTLMSIGPLVALALTISGYILSNPAHREDNIAKKAVVSAIEWVAPQMNSGAKSAAALRASATDTEPHKLGEISANLDKMVDQLLENAANGKAGIIGLTLVIGLAVLMLSRVEDALNGIWGVRQGRSWRDRFANYLLFLVLFFLVGAATLTMLSAAAIAHAVGQGTSLMGEWLIMLPGGERIVFFLSGNGPLLLSLALLTLVFTLFHRMMPNVRIRWSAALVGGFCVALFIVLNHLLSALYVSHVTELQALYGGVSIIVIFMFGTYLSWLFLLAGGQIAYAFQHRRALARHRDWEHLSHRARRTLAFVCSVETLRRYQAGEPGPRTQDLAEVAKIPSTAVEGCLQMLRDAGLLAAERFTEGHRPARPLEKMTVGELWNLVDGRSHGHVGEPDLSSDPAALELSRIEKRLLSGHETALTLGELAAK